MNHYYENRFALYLRMMRKLIKYSGLAVLIALAFAGCSKDKYASKPSLKFKSISSYDVPNKGLFEIRLEYTDLEGDLSTADSALIIHRDVARCPSGSIDFKYKLPSVPTTKNASGDIVIHFENNGTDYLNAGYATYTPAPCVTGSYTDTTTFKFYIRDVAGNVSDTITIDKPVLIRRQ